jgi:cytochrome c oxidase subunit II
MAADSVDPAQAAPDAAEPRHALRIFVIWLVASAIADPLLWFVLGPHMPPGAMSDTAASQQVDLDVMALMSAPVTLFVIIYFVYALVVFRQRAGDDEDGPPIHGNNRISALWIGGTAVVVLSLFVYGTVRLISPAGAGGGEGNTPIWRPSGATLAAQTTPWQPGTVLEVQVIAQQWWFTYRYPQLGGFETTHLMLPAGQEVQFDVTSLDVIHSFWAYQLGVKADANPGVDNVAYAKTVHTGIVNVRCSELCGLWHGAMFDYGAVVPLAQFQAWAAATKTQLAALTAQLPPFALTYDANSITQLGKVFRQAGLSGAGGGYYGPQYPAQP